MSYGGRPLPSHLRHPSTSGNQPSAGQSPLLLARINEKKAELASLKDLQALSAALADQMQQLEEKLATLTDGTEAVATVLSNWHNVLRAISMASEKLPKPKEDEGEPDHPLPQTLVRIPTQQPAVLSPQTTSGAEAEE